MNPLSSALASTAITVTLLLPAAPASAQTTSCQADIAKLCARSTPGRGQVAGCLRQNLEQISGPCKAQLQAVSVQLKETRQPCEDDLLRFCDGADLTEARIAACLNRNRAALAPECRRLSDLLQKTR